MSGTKKTQAETTAATAAAVEARAAASKAKEGSKEPVAYVGPDIKNVAINGTVYIDGLPEPLQEKKVVQIAEEIERRVNLDEPVRLVLITGPSSSGKSTFCKRLSIQLKA